MGGAESRAVTRDRHVYGLIGAPTLPAAHGPHPSPAGGAGGAGDAAHAAGDVEAAAGGAGPPAGAAAGAGAGAAGPRVVPRGTYAGGRATSGTGHGPAYLAGVQLDIETMRSLFRGGQEVEELFVYGQADAASRGAPWLRARLTETFARDDVRSYWLYYAGHGCEGNGAWYLGGGADNMMEPRTMLETWRDSPAGRSGEATLVVISDSCYSGHWVSTARDMGLRNVAVQSSTDEHTESFDTPGEGGVFTYNVYNAGRALFKPITTAGGFATAAVFGVPIVLKAAANGITRGVKALTGATGELHPQVYQGADFGRISGRSGGTVQPSSVINAGNFLLVDGLEWAMFRPVW